MFYFFQKKKFLVDSLENFIDIHNHILPGIDDGAKTVEDSINLIKGFADFGVTTFIATPHIIHNYYPNNPKTINDSLLVLKSELSKQNMNDISIQAAAEHMIDDNFESILKNDLIMPLENNYLLIEMSYLQASINFEEAISKIKKKGYFPILAHPERYLYLYNNYKKHFKNKKQGMFYQINLLSLSKYYGKEVQEMAYGLLEKNLIDFVGSDIHNIGQLNSLKDVELTEKYVKMLKPLLRRTIRSI